MGLGLNTINTWDEIKEIFLEKYKDYCKGNDMKGDDIFRMQQKEDEILEDYVSRFLFCLRKSPHQVLNEESQNLLFLRGINESCIDTLDLIGGCDITQVPQDDIKKICQK